MRRKIRNEQWLEFKPYSGPKSTDFYYINLCNEVKQALVKDKSNELLLYLDEEDINLLACLLVSYLEDLVSETEVWNTFVGIHEKLYGKKLPFYSLEVYYEKEVNIQDVTFLVWYVLNLKEEGQFLGPFHNAILEPAKAATEILYAAYETAPENVHLKKYYRLDADNADFYEVRKLIQTILFQTYLFVPDTLFRLKILEERIIENHADTPHMLQLFNENTDSFTHLQRTRLLSLKGIEWLEALVAQNDSRHAEWLKLSPKITGYFLYKGQDEVDLFIEHLATGKSFKLTKKSFDHYKELTKIDTILFLGIILWRSEWWFTGVFFSMEYNERLARDEQKNLQSRQQVAFLDDTGKVEEILELQYKAFLDFNAGSPIAFMPSEAIETFSKDYMEFYRESLDLDKKTLEKSKKRAQKRGFDPEKHSGNFDFSNTEASGLVFFNSKSGIEMAFGVNSAFPLNNNPFFNEENSTEDVIHLLLSSEMSVELARFCVKNAKDKLPIFTDGMGLLIQNDLDFLLRFWKYNIYHVKPAITVV